MDALDPALESDQRARVAVLGGTGFVGRAVCRTLSDRGYDVIALARRQQAVPGARRVVAIDLTSADSGTIAEIFRAERIGVVINAAGGMWGLTDEQMVAANLTLVERVIDAAAALPRPARLVQLSTVHEYGLVPIGESMDESLVASPVTVYGELKLRCTHAVSQARQQGRLDGVCLRIGNVDRRWPAPPEPARRGGGQAAHRTGRWPPGGSGTRPAGFPARLPQPVGRGRRHPGRSSCSGTGL